MNKETVHQGKGTAHKQEDELVFGKHAVFAFLRQLLAGKSSPAAAVESARQANPGILPKTNQADQVSKLLIMHGMHPDQLDRQILDLAHQLKLPVQTVSRRELDEKVGSAHHQGVAATLSHSQVLQYQDFLDLLSRHENSQREKAQNIGESIMVAVLDGIEDPHNLGAIIRVAEAAGALAAFIPRHRSATVTGTVAKTSAGASAILPIVQVTNLVQTVEALKKSDFWIIGLRESATLKYTQADLKRRVAIVIGGEGKGISRLLAEHCDLLVSIPMLGHTESLNAAVAAGIMLYEVVRQNRLLPS